MGSSSEIHILESSIIRQLAPRMFCGKYDTLSSPKAHVLPEQFEQATCEECKEDFDQYRDSLYEALDFDGTYADFLDDDEDFAS